MSRDRERGVSRVKAISWILVIGACIFVAVKVIPIYFANFELEDKMHEEARFAQANRRSIEDLKDIIFRAAQNLDLPTRREDIRVEMDPSGTRIGAEYTVTVDLKVTQLKLYLHPHS